MTGGSRFQRSEIQATSLPAAVAAATPAHMRAHAEGNNTGHGSLQFPCCRLVPPPHLQTEDPSEEGIIRREM